MVLGVGNRRSLISYIAEVGLQAATAWISKATSLSKGVDQRLAVDDALFFLRAIGRAIAAMIFPT